MIRESVYFNGRNSLSDFGLTIAERRHEGAELRRITETVPFRDRSLDFTRADGKAHYDPRRETVIFNLIAPNPTALTILAGQVRDWLEESAGGELYYATEPGRCYTNVTALVSPMERVSPRVARLTVVFECDPRVTLGHNTITLLGQLTKARGGMITVTGSTVTAGDFSEPEYAVSQQADNLFVVSPTPDTDLYMYLEVAFPEPYSGTTSEYGYIRPGKAPTKTIEPARKLWSDSQNFRAWYFVPAEYAGSFSMSSWDQEPEVSGVAQTPKIIIGADPARELIANGTYYINGKAKTILSTGDNVLTTNSTEALTMTQSIPREVF